MSHSNQLKFSSIKKNEIIYKGNYGEGSISEWTELFNSAIN